MRCAPRGAGVAPALKETVGLKTGPPIEDPCTIPVLDSGPLTGFWMDTYVVHTVLGENLAMMHAINRVRALEILHISL